MAALAISISHGVALIPPAGAQDFEALSKELRSADQDGRREAALQLQEAGAAALPALPALIEALRDDDEQVSARAVTAIARIGSQAGSAIPALIDSMETERRRYDAQVVFRSAFALAQIGAPAVDALREALKSPSRGKRSGAAQALQIIGAPAATAIPELVAALHDDEAEVRDPAAEALAAMGMPALDALEADLKDSPCSAAVRAVGLIGSAAASAAPQLIGLIQASRDNKPMYAAILEALGGIVTPFDQLTPVLRVAITDDAELVRRAAASVMLGYPEASEHSLPLLQKWLTEDDAELRSKATWIVGQFGADAASLAPDLIRQLGNGDDADTITGALAGLGPAAADAILAALAGTPVEALRQDEAHWARAILKNSGPLAMPALERGLESEHASIRFVALDALSGLGKIARPLEPKFRKASNDPEPAVRLAALIALEEDGADPQRLATILQRRSSDESAEVRAVAVRLLAKAKDGNRQAFALILQALDDPDPGVQVAAVAALKPFGPEAEAAVPRLQALAASPDSTAKLAILQAFASIGPGASEALPFVQAALADANPQIRGAAISALVAIEPEGESLTQVLAEMLADQDPAVRHPAIDGLGQRGEGARSAAPLLFKLLDEEEDRSEALEALRRIGATDPDLYIIALDNPEPRVRLFACEALGRLGKAAEKAIPRLEQAKQDRYDFVRRRAEDAIERIRR